ncbi:hypothetical protein CB1_000899003 [Camelus ferus]|nr:hypothetical protein CB1_000899003 [Camelus ferus]
MERNSILFILISLFGGINYYPVGEGGALEVDINESLMETVRDSNPGITRHMSVDAGKQKLRLDYKYDSCHARDLKTTPKQQGVQLKAFFLFH